MIYDFHLDPMEIQNARPDRDHIFRELSVHQRIAELTRISESQPYPSTDKDRWDKLKAHHRSLQMKLNALSEALDARNSDTLRLGVCNLEVAIGALSYLADLSIEKDLITATDALVTQFCTEGYDLDATLEHYQDLGLYTYTTMDTVSGYVTVYSKTLQKDRHGTTYSEHQILKSVFYREPRFNYTH